MGVLDHPTYHRKKKTKDVSKIRCTQLGVGDMVLLKRTAFKDEHKIQDHCEKTIYHVEGQPYMALLVFRITPVVGKVR